MEGAWKMITSGRQNGRGERKIRDMDIYFALR